MKEVEQNFYLFLDKILNYQMVSYLMFGFVVGYLLIKSIKLLLIGIILFILVVIWNNFNLHIEHIHGAIDIADYMLQKVTFLVKEYLASIKISEIIAIIVGFIIGLKFG